MEKPASPVACVQALLGLGAGGGKRRELVTMSQEFSFLRRKSRCKMLIGGYLNLLLMSLLSALNALSSFPFPPPTPKRACSQATSPAANPESYDSLYSRSLYTGWLQTIYVLNSKKEEVNIFPAHKLLQK